jgi:hypothetical protein
MVEDWQGYQEDEARHQGRYLLAEADRELTPDDQLSAVQRGPDGGWNLAFGRRDARRDDPCEAPPDLRDQLLALGAERAGRRSDLPGEGGFGPWKLGALTGRKLHRPWENAPLSPLFLSAAFSSVSSPRRPARGPPEKPGRGMFLGFRTSPGSSAA